MGRIFKRENIWYIDITIGRRRVASLASDHREAGMYTVTWAATEFASGVYFYRLTAGEYIETKKMLLLK